MTRKDSRNVESQTDSKVQRGAGSVRRREFLAQGAAAVGAAAGGVLGSAWAGNAGATEPGPPGIEPWQTAIGMPLRGYGMPSHFEDPVKRRVANIYGNLAPGTGVAYTPLESLEGTITPNGLHFERSHNGAPDIDPSRHRLMIHGLVKQPLIFSVPDLLRYPMESHIHFLECSGNSSQGVLPPQPVQQPAGVLHGLVSCCEWTGIKLSVLLQEAGIDPKATWLLAEGADAAGLSRSIPIEKALDDAMLVLYQNGERLRPEQGYPVRLLLPGWEGNMSVKWLRRLKLTEGPTHTRWETSKYTDALPGGKSLQFTFEMGVKSVITRPSPTMTLPGRGLVEISGIAWSGAGRIASVEVSTDGGKSWRNAALQGEHLPKSLVRFRLPWEWDGTATWLQSRARDEKGQVQPTRKEHLARYGVNNVYHNNSIVTWAVDAEGRVTNVYA